MKNTIIINAKNHCSCDLVSNVNDGTNRVFLEIHSDMNLSPVLNVGDSIVTITGSPFVYEIPSNLLIGSSQLIFNIADIVHEGDNFYINQLGDLSGQLYLRQIDNFNYSLISVKQNTTGVPIATKINLGVVKGGANVEIDPDGTMRVNETGIEYITNARIDEICI